MCRARGLRLISGNRLPHHRDRRHWLYGARGMARQVPVCPESHAPAPPQVTEPGLYSLRPEHYHADPVPGGSLSSGGARRMLPPSCPARFQAYIMQPYRSRPMELGIAAHRLVLGTGPDIDVLMFPDYTAKAAQRAAADSRVAGRVPVLSREWDQIRAMRDAIAGSPETGDLLGAAADRGTSEAAIFWTDPGTGGWCRTQLDWLPHPHAMRRAVIIDYKTTVSADRSAIEREISNYGYHQQADWCLRGVDALGLADWSPDPAVFAFIFQEKTPPYLTRLVQLDAEAMMIGRERNDLALRRWAQCRETGEWPGYGGGTMVASLPRWAPGQHRAQMAELEIELGDEADEPAAWQ